jgi:hypothetical protein
MLLNRSSRGAVFEVQRHFRDFEQIQALPSDRIALFIHDLKVPVRGLGVITELDIYALPILQRVLPQNVFSPFVCTVRRNEELRDLDAGVIHDREVLVPGERRYWGEARQSDGGEASQRQFDNSSAVC